MTKTSEIYSLGKRMLSFVLALVMLVGLVNIAAPTTAQAVEYAKPATEEELDTVAYWFSGNDGVSGNAAFAKIINGSVYVWGANGSYVLGITSYINENGEKIDVGNGTIVPTPTKIPQEYFNGESVLQVKLSNNGGMALTDQNHLFAWGAAAIAFKYTSYATPQQVDTTPLNGKGIHYFYYGFPNAYIVDDEGILYTIAGYPNAAIPRNYGTDLMLDTTTEDAFGIVRRVPDALYGKLGITNGLEIEEIMACWSCNTVILTKNGDLYGFGNDAKDNGGQHTLGMQTGGMFKADPARMTLDAPSAIRGLKFVNMSGEDRGRAFVSSEGDVWVLGQNNNGRFGDSVGLGLHITETTKVFNHVLMGKRAVRVWVDFVHTVILCEDNTVYALGLNNNGMIVPNGDTSINVPTQVGQKVSETQTITGVFPNKDGMMYLSKAGDMAFAGDNTTGGAGDGTSDNKPVGELTNVVSPMLPPSAPLTANKVSFEIEVQEGNQKVFYTPEVSGTGNTYARRVGNSQPVGGQTLTIDAGRPFKLNVYFEDFGKINTFTMPIRFDQSKLEVVNGAGNPYSSASDVVTPGAIGSSVGIEQCFDVRDWNGGTLAVGSRDGTYPKISNADGWVSVMGYSADANPIIQGKVKMFSISFRAKTTSQNVAFAFADNDNYIGDGAPLGSGYDTTANGLENFSAFWSIYNSAGDGGESGYYDFKHEPFPIFATRLVPMRALDMTLTYGDKDDEVTTKMPESETKYTPGWEINWGNSSVNYKLTANAYSDTGKTATGVSFPQVNWSYEIMRPDGANNLDRNLEDVIQITDEQDTYLRFKINPAFVPRADETPIVIKFYANGKSYTAVNATYYVKLRSYDAPASLQIAQKASDGTITPIGDGVEIIYHGTPVDNNSFYVDFGNPNELTNPTQNKEVVWSLLDSAGNTILSSDPEAKVTLDSTGVDATSTLPIATITPRNTTPNNDYVTLHVESLYDASVYDEVKIKVQLYATELGFSQKTLRIPVEKDGVPSSIDLSKYIQVKPVDVYATDYTWTITGTPTRDPANAGPDFVAGTPVLYGSLGSGTTAAVFTAYDWATPKADADNTEEYVTVTVTDSYSGKSASIDIAILDLNSPIGIDDIATNNVLGTMGDIVTIKTGLKDGDVIKFYKEYDDVAEGKDAYMTVNVQAGMYPSFTFAVGNTSKSLMEGAGGFIGVQLIRKESEGADPVTYDAIPVWYDAEPSLVDGYVHLYGKNTGTIYDQNIRIDLAGLNFKETVYTDANGYFKFTKYIAPGNYSMVVSKKNYLTRRMEDETQLTIQVNDDGEFHISTYQSPILLFPGELTNDNAITVQDITYYVANWVGLSNRNITDYDLYDFKEDGLISAKDLELLLMRKDWVSGSYPKWNVPEQ